MAPQAMRRAAPLPAAWFGATFVAIGKGVSKAPPDVEIVANTLVVLDTAGELAPEHWRDVSFVCCPCKEQGTFIFVERFMLTISTRI